MPASAVEFLRMHWVATCSLSKSGNNGFALTYIHIDKFVSKSTWKLMCRSAIRNRALTERSATTNFESFWWPDVKRFQSVQLSSLLIQVSRKTSRIGHERNVCNAVCLLWEMQGDDNLPVSIWTSDRGGHYEVQCMRWRCIMMQPSPTSIAMNNS